MSLEVMKTPDLQVMQLDDPATPVDYDGSFLFDEIGIASGYDALQVATSGSTEPMRSFKPNPFYDRYLKINKVFVGAGGSERLEEVYARLKDETLPKYVAAAGWAAIEAAIGQRTKSQYERHQLMVDGAKCLVRALRQQRALNELGHQHSSDHEYPYRLAMDLATLPLLAGVVRGDVTDEAVQRSFEDCLNVAQANIVAMRLAGTAGDIDAFRSHVGFGYECNAMLSLNRLQFRTWFAVPSSTRSDSGNYNGDQTHDLVVVHQRWGEMISATPVEIKGHPTRDDKTRYDALLVRAKMHLSSTGKHLPEDTLDAIAACYEKKASDRQKSIAEDVTRTFKTMLRDYNEGEPLPKFHSPRLASSFRDRSLVTERHPGLAVA